MKKEIVIIVFSIIILNSCNLGFSGTLGGGKTYRYDCNKEKLNFYLDSIESNSTSLKIPESWEKYDDWEQRGFRFLKGKIFYINEKKDDIEEMYYVSVIPPIAKSNRAGVAIRSVFRAKEYLLGWKTFEDLPRSEKKEIEERFKRLVLNKVPLKIVSIED